MSNRRLNKEGYEVFLADMAAAFRSKLDKDETVSDAEFKALVATTFRKAVLKFTKESKLLRVEIPIDVYEGVKSYDIIPPPGFYVEAVIRLRTGTAKLPTSYTFDDSEIILHGCCPKRNIEKAWYAEVALVPLRSSKESCYFDEEFLSKYYDAIYAAMFMFMVSMPMREWKSTNLISVAKRDYQLALYSAVKGGTDTLRPIKLKFRRLSDGLSKGK